MTNHYIDIPLIHESKRWSKEELLDETNLDHRDDSYGDEYDYMVGNVDDEGKWHGRVITSTLSKSVNMYRHGKRHGWCMEYNDIGGLCARSEYEDDCLHGIHQIIDGNSSISKQSSYKKGKVYGYQLSGEHMFRANHMHYHGEGISYSMRPRIDESDYVNLTKIEYVLGFEDRSDEHGDFVMIVNIKEDGSREDLQAWCKYNMAPNNN